MRSKRENADQRTLARAGFDVNRKTTRPHEFLRAMNRAIPPQAPAEMVEPYSPKTVGPGCPVAPLV